MHSIYWRFCVHASLTILLSVGTFSQMRGKEAKVMVFFRETEIKLTNTMVHCISPTLFQTEVGDSHDTCEEPHVKNEEGIHQQRGLNVRVRSSHGPLSTSEPKRETISLLV
jgi:hypothetical protein